MNTSIGHKDTVQARTTNIHSRLVIQTNHKLNKDEEIPRMSISINAIETYINIMECMTARQYD